MLKKLRQQGRGLARNDAATAWKEDAAGVRLIDINPLVNCSQMTYLFGRPYPVQFRHQGAIEAWTRALETTEVWRCWQDPGTLCRQIRTDILRTLELIFATKRQDLNRGHVSLLGDTDRGSGTIGEWLTRVLAAAKEQPEEEFHRPMHAAVSYVVRVFLYMALKQARVTEHRDHEAALRRAAGLGERKRAKLLQRAASLYDGITVGPESLPSSAPDCALGGSVTPHWRRGHFRMQPRGAGKQQRKLIFVAPVLVHADQLQGELPTPKPYRAGAGAVTAA